MTARKPTAAAWSVPADPDSADHACEWPLSIAVEHLRGSETFQMCRHFAAKDISDLGAVQMLVGVVWAFENRHAPVAWDVIANWEVGQLVAYFPEEPVEPDAPLALKSGGV